MTYMHSLGVAHRDLKLENLLLDAPNGNVKICDFGLAHVFERRPDGSFATTKLTRCCGTKSYTPPEVLAGMPYDGFLQINPRRRISMSRVAQSSWLCPSPVPQLNLDTTLTSSTISCSPNPGTAYRSMEEDDGDAETAHADAVVRGGKD